MLDANQRQLLRRTISVSNRKGGVGKTSITANVGGVLADAGYRVLLVDLDPQGTLGDDLGYRGTEQDDQGAALFSALVMGQELRPVKGIRPGLDVIPAGSQTTNLVDALIGKTLRGESPQYLFAEKLATIAASYDVILIDCPPGDNALLTQAFVAARWVLIPTQPDSGSLHGLEQLAEKVIATKPANPTIMPLGAILFGIDGRAKRMREDKHKVIAEIMGDLAPVFTTAIRLSQTTGVQARQRGVLVGELGAEAEEQKKDRIRWARLLKAQKDGAAVDEAEVAELTMKRKLSRRISETAETLAGDYVELTGEIIHALATHEKGAA